MLSIRESVERLRAVGQQSMNAIDLFMPTISSAGLEQDLSWIGVEGRLVSWLSFFVTTEGLDLCHANYK